MKLFKAEYDMKQGYSIDENVSASNEWHKTI